LPLRAATRHEIDGAGKNLSRSGHGRGVGSACATPKCVDQLDSGSVDGPSAGLFG
jgi:hypothetical protein